MDYTKDIKEAEIRLNLATEGIDSVREILEQVKQVKSELYSGDITLSQKSVLDGMCKDLKKYLAYLTQTQKFSASRIEYLQGLSQGGTNGEIADIPTTDTS